MNRLRRFAVVGAVATAADLLVLFVVWGLADVSAALADTISIATAAVVSYTLHRRLTFVGDPQTRWVSRPDRFLLIAASAGATDIAIVSLVAGATNSAPRVLLAKVLGLALASVVRVIALRAVLLQMVRGEQSAPAGRPSPPGTVRLSVVVPAYRCVATIGETVRQVKEALAEVDREGGLEVIIVDDGSGDGTAEAARGAGAHRVIEQPKNRGKGAAVRAGVLAASGRNVVFTDADLSYSPDQILDLLAELESGWDVVVGSRHHEEAVTLVRARRLRELTGRVFNLFTALVLLGRYRDTQCGLKGFRSDVARLVFGRSLVDGFAFDVEIFHLVERYRLSLLELPARLDSSDTSTVRVGSDALRMVRDLVRIRRAGARGAYDVPGDLPLPAIARPPA